MRNIYFISYGNQNYSESLKRICLEAEKTGVFSKIISYSEKDIPDIMKSSNTFQQERGGGYWLWKPYIIWQTLNIMQDDDYLLYCDAGCTIIDKVSIHSLLSKLSKYDIICFELGISSLNLKYCKKAVFKYFNKSIPYLFPLCSQIMSGCMLIKKTSSSFQLIEEWKNIAIQNPELFDDNVSGKESKYFIEHRHDQAILSAILYKYLHLAKIKIMPNLIDLRLPYKQAIFASRKSDKATRSAEKKISVLEYYLRTKIIHFLVRLKNQIFSSFF